MFSGRLILIGLSSALSMTSPLLAQAEVEQAPPKQGEIVVTGKLPEPTQSEVARQAREITRQTGIRYAPLPRFEGDRLCPGVIGLKTDFAGIVINRVRANAERLGLWMAKDDGTCAPNFVIAFVDDGRGILQKIADDQYWLFKDMPRHERIELLADEGPVHVWTTTQARTRDGMNLPDGPDGRKASAMGSGGRAGASLRVREDITGVLILFDQHDVSGLSLIQLADYATMRGLARTQPVDGGGQPMETILALFDKDYAPPAEMTSFDRAYLRALYSQQAITTGLSTLLRVSREMDRQAREEMIAADE